MKVMSSFFSSRPVCVLAFATSSIMCLGKLSQPPHSANTLFVIKEYHVDLFSQVHQLYKYLSVNSMCPYSSFACFSLG